MTLFYQLDRKQTRDITVPQGIRAIAENAFNSSACSSIILPDSLTEIGSNAFGSCPNLKELVIPEGVKTIGGQAVYGCENLESITIPSTVEYIDGGLFGSNKALTKVVVSPDNPNYEMIDHLLVDKRDMKIVMALNSTPAKYEIPEGIKKIGFMAFQGSDDLEELVVPEGLTEIGTSAFSGCSKLCKITLPASVNEIETYVFEYSYHLVIKAPEGSYAQEFCKKNGYEFITNS